MCWCSSSCRVVLYHAQLVLQELLGPNEHKQELLQAVWRAFLVLAEHCMKVSRQC